MLKHVNIAASMVAAGILVLGTGFGQSSATDASKTTDKAADKASSGAASSALSGGDRKFVMEAAMGGLTEVQAGQMVAGKSTNADVKAVAQKIVDDHTKANDELKTIASGKGITLPTDLDPKHKAMVDKMSAMSGDQMDHAFLMNMMKDHKKDIALFQKESSNGKDADLKAFATKTLPVLQEHAKHVQEAHSKSMGSGSDNKKMSMNK